VRCVLVVKPSPWKWRLYALVLSFCLSVRSLVRPSSDTRAAAGGRQRPQRCCTAHTTGVPDVCTLVRDVDEHVQLVWVSLTQRYSNKLDVFVDVTHEGANIRDNCNYRYYNYYMDLSSWAILGVFYRLNWLTYSEHEQSVWDGRACVSHSLDRHGVVF